MKTIFGREPALWLALVASSIQVLSAFLLDLSPGVQGSLNAVAIAAAGIFTAVGLEAEKLVPAILGGVQAVLALGLAFGLDFTPEDQSIVMGFAAVVVAMFVRTQVVAPPA